MTRLLALDVSLRATGIRYPDGTVDTLRPPRGVTGGARLAWWQDSFRIILANERPYRVVVERPFAGKLRGDSSAKLQQLYGVLLVELWRAFPSPVVTWVPPARLKLLWTGHGGASKAMMVAEALRRGIAVGNDNEADAAALWSCCLAGMFDPAEPAEPGVS